MKVYPCVSKRLSLHVGDVLPVLAEQKLHENNHAPGTALHSNLFQEISRTLRLGQALFMIHFCIKKNNRICFAANHLIVSLFFCINIQRADW